MNYYSIVLCAGKGTRMKSAKPKVLQTMIDKPMASLVINELVQAGIKDNFLIVGYKKEMIIEELNNSFDNLKYVVQEEQLGTGHAIAMARDLMSSLKGTTIITCGDTPLLTSEIFKNLISYHEDNKNDLTILSTKLDNPFGYGRIVRQGDNKVSEIVEQKDATDEQTKIQEINSGIYCIDNELLFKYIKEIDNKNAQEEYYLTDIISIFKQKNHQVDAYCIEDSISLMGVNDHVNLAKATKELQLRINEQHLINGVKIIDPQNTYIGKDVVIKEGTIIYPNNFIVGKTTIGANNILKSSNTIEDCTIGNDNAIGPMAFLRGNTVVEDEVRIGNFVEMKNTLFSTGAKAAHLTYLGDSTIGQRTNIGCGVITANYDGYKKYKTIVGKDSFVGSNVNLIAPVNIGENTFIAAGTTVNRDVDDEKFVIGRVKQEIKDKKQ